MDKLEIKEIVGRQLQGKAGAQEWEALMAFARDEANAKVLETVLKEQWSVYQTEADLPAGRSELLFRSILDAAAQLQPDEVESYKPVVRRMGVWWAAAAVVLMLVVGWWLVARSPESGDQTASAEARSAKADVEAPAINKAMVTLSDGRMVSLDSIQNGLLADQGGVQLVKQADGQIQYLPHPHPLSTSGEGGGVGVMNTLSNPRGSKVIDLTLSDGTRVWLNAGSSITYPVVFAGNERRVSIKGEGYFEVTKNKTKPFYVQFPSPRSGESLSRPFGRAGGEVMVLGTHFNINAYDDEADIRVTLLEGLVKVSATTDKSPGVPSRPRALAVTLSPGQQAIATHDSRLTTHDKVDLDQVMAWKNGRFDFGDKADIQSIMRQVARWYDVDIEYRGTVDQQFWGGMSRQESVSKLLEKFELTGRVHFRIEGRKIIVSP